MDGPRDLVCQLWTDLLRTRLEGYSLHESDDLFDWENASRSDPTFEVLRIEGHPYKVEVLPGDPRSEVRRLHRGLPSFTVVDPSGILDLLKHLSRDEILDRCDAYWNPGRGSGSFRFPSWKEVHGRKFPLRRGVPSERMNDYAELVRRLRRERGTYIVKIDGIPNENKDMLPRHHIFFARRTPEQLLNELTVAQVMEV